ncbi:MAG: hypothetical protein KGN76_10895 [Acidobacteriota bacterium]|nr:hypothetical protein [Acidobacteriota bacterium]
MSQTDRERERWLTARHEAGHAVAAFHYGVPVAQVFAKPDGVSLGSTRIAQPELPEDAVVIFCGPLAETEWAEFKLGAHIRIRPVGTDLEGLKTLADRYGDLDRYYEEALSFIQDPIVQTQVDQLAQALLVRGRLNDSDARAAAGFVQSRRRP